jgi:hypothetical protein|tara:strand:+ start:285 stop:608 length:324 start_codon:yes stop_codon:yes gene_type:complete
MIHKKIFFGLLILVFLGACAAPTAMLGPAYTLSSSGNVLQAGFSYGSSELIKSYTGKTPLENLKEISELDLDHKRNIQKQTLESLEFHILVKNRVKKNNQIIKLTNQ